MDLIQAVKQAGLESSSIECDRMIFQNRGFDYSERMVIDRARICVPSSDIDGEPDVCIEIYQSFEDPDLIASKIPVALTLGGDWDLGIRSDEQGRERDWELEVAGERAIMGVIKHDPSELEDLESLLLKLQHAIATKAKSPHIREVLARGTRNERIREILQDDPAPQVVKIASRPLSYSVVQPEETEIITSPPSDAEMEMIREHLEEIESGAYKEYYFQILDPRSDRWIETEEVAHKYIPVLDPEDIAVLLDATADMGKAEILGKLSTSKISETVRAVEDPRVRELLSEVVRDFHISPYDYMRKRLREDQVDAIAQALKENPRFDVLLNLHRAGYDLTVEDIETAQQNTEYRGLGATNEFLLAGEVNDLDLLKALFRSPDPEVRGTVVRRASVDNMELLEFAAENPYDPDAPQYDPDSFSSLFSPASNFAKWKLDLIAQGEADMTRRMAKEQDFPITPIDISSRLVE